MFVSSDHVHSPPMNVNCSAVGSCAYRRKKSYFVESEHQGLCVNREKTNSILNYRSFVEDYKYFELIR